MLQIKIFYQLVQELPHSDFKITIKIRVIKTDVTVGSIQIPDAQISITDNLPILSTDGWYEVKVDVSMVGALDILNTYVSIPVVLTLGNVIQTAWIPAHELSQENSRQISIWINPNWNYLGLQDLKISVNPDKSFEENNFENNQVVQQVYVVGKYKIEKKILYSTDNGATFNPHPNPDFFQMRPTVDTSNTHCKSVYTYSRVRIVLECQKDDGTDEKVDGCEVMITKKLGNHFGGHLFHNNEDRPLGSFVRNQMPYNIDEEYKTIPEDGLTFAYEAPDPSGEVVLSFDVKSPDGIDILVPESTARVGIGGLVRIDDIPNLTMVSTGHYASDGRTELGVYVTPRFKQQMRAAIAEYYNRSRKAGIPEDQIISLRSEAASLVWGGLYDIMHNWQPSHCGHRIGNALDIGMWDFNNSKSSYKDKMRLFLRQALLNNKLSFPVPSESPSGNKHWHTQSN